MTKVFAKIFTYPLYKSISFLVTLASSTDSGCYRSDYAETQPQTRKIQLVYRCVKVSQKPIIGYKNILVEL